MTSDHSDCKRKPVVVTSWADLSYLQNGILYMYHSIDRIVHIIVFDMS